MGIKARIHDRLLERQDSTAARLALETLSSAVATARARRPCRMRLDGPRWIHSYREGAIVSTTAHPDLPPPDEISSRIEDQFCHQRRPRHGDTVIDVGAGIGEALLLFSSLVGPSGRVIAIEAHPGLFACLERAIEVNGLSNVTALQAAVTATPGGSVSITDEDAWYANTIMAPGGPGSIEVPGLTLDEVVAEHSIDGIGLLKMNIEGAEVPALRGMSDSLDRCRAVAVECHDFRAEDPGDPAFGDPAFRTKETVIGTLAAAGFEIASRADHANPAFRDTVYASRPAEPA
jgi:FkbM family methyltransferase